nr:hypothetical protein 53 [Balneolaceae bacterium]
MYQASQKINQLQAENARLSMELSYLEGKYQEKYVFVDTPDGEQLARLVSIDGGKNYVEINRQREILYPPYFKQRYPGQELAELRTLPHKTR